MKSILLLCGLFALLQGAVSELIVYQNSLGKGFQDWSWSNEYNLQATDRYRSMPCSIGFTPRDFKGIFFHFPKGADTDTYSGVRFYIHPGASGGQVILFGLASAGENVLFYQLPAFVPNVWNEIKIDFKQMSFTGSFDGIWFQDSSDYDWNKQGRLWIDDISFIGYCDGVRCPNNAVCKRGACVCAGGFGGTNCAIKPSLSGLTLTDPDTRTQVRKLSASESAPVLIEWRATGNISSISLALVDVGSSMPIHQYLAPWVESGTGGGKFLWDSSSQFDSGRYKLRAFYNDKVYVESGVLEKVEGASRACSRSCSYRGTCGPETNYKCRCKYGFTGSNCEDMPEDVYALNLVAILNIPFDNSKRFPSRLKSNIVADISLALGILPQQIEVKDMDSYSNGASTQVEFSVFIGGEFDYKITVIEVERACKRMLEDKDSQLSRSLYSYETIKASSAFLSATGSILSFLSPLLLVLFFMLY